MNVIIGKHGARRYPPAFAENRPDERGVLRQLLDLDGVGRVEFCRAQGIRYRDMEVDDGVLLVVAEANCRYLAPARYDDEVRITALGAATPRMVRFDYELYDQTSGVRLANGFTKHIFCGRNFRPAKLPQKYWPQFNM